MAGWRCSTSFDPRCEEPQTRRRFKRVSDWARARRGAQDPRPWSDGSGSRPARRRTASRPASLFARRPRVGSQAGEATLTSPGQSRPCARYRSQCGVARRRTFSVETMVIGMIVWMVVGVIVRMIVRMVVWMIVGVIIRMVIRMVVGVVVWTAVWIITVDAFDLGKR